MRRTLTLLSLYLFMTISCSDPARMVDNPFYAPSPLHLEAPDFDAINPSHFRDAFTDGMQFHLEEIEEIANNSDEPDFENTIVAMERAGVLLTRSRRVFSNLTSAHTNEELQAIQTEFAPKFAAHSDNILLNNTLFSRIETLYERKDELNLASYELKLIEDTYRNFVRAGALLNEEEQVRMREINERISTLTTQFAENVLQLNRERAVLIEDEELLDGLSPDRIAAAREAAASRDEVGYLLTITNTTRVPILTSLNNRDVRRAVWEASAFRGLGLNGGIDNRPLVLELAALRAERASLLGYSDFASFAIEPQTAQTPEAVLRMLQGLIPSVIRNSEREAEKIITIMRADGIEDELQPWDWEYYADKVRKAEFDLDEAAVRPYFELDRVLKDGVFYTMNRLYGISFEERFDLPVYHPDVRVFDVIDHDGTELGLFYADLFARDSKRGGAWMSSFVSQSHLTGQRPVITNVLNIPKPAEGEPALISFSNVTTLFHEMGHAVHGLFSDVTYPSQSGTSVPRDFVEFPSTFEEDWAVHPEVLPNYAVHHETGERIPDELLERVIAARDFNQGFDTYEYLAATMIDMEWHLLSFETITATDINVEEFEAAALVKYNLANPVIAPRYKSAYFSHIFSGGYSANYYAYIWSEILAADAFAFMRENGGLTRDNGDHYRESILSKGGTEDAMEMYRKFRGGDPDVRYLLIRRGLSAD